MSKLNKLPPYQNPSLGTDTRVRDLVERMTLQEKVRQMVQFNVNRVVRNGRVSTTAIRKIFGKLSVGCIQDIRLAPDTNAEAVNAIQKYLTKETRLGIPAMVTSECLHGHFSTGATIFPQAIGLGSTWDPELIRKMASAIAKEARAVGCAQALSPDLDLALDPRWGRVEETYGEDPYLVARMGVAYINGMQGEGETIDREHLACTAKHFAIHGQPEAGINLAPVAAGAREIRTTHLKPFEAAVRKAGVHSIMPAYSEYDGVPASSSRFLLQKLLREEWGFNGYTYSDYRAIHMLKTFHKTAGSAGEAAKQALLAGMDLEAPCEYGFGKELIRLVNKGEIDIELINLAVARVLRVKFLAGLFENPYAKPKKERTVINCAEHKKLAHRIAEESIILLKNDDGLLPLSRKTRRIAVIGPNADTAQLGDYCVVKPDATSPLEGIRNCVSKRTDVVFAKGCGICESDTNGFAKAVKTASESDVAIVCIGGNSSVMAGTGWGTSKAVATCGEGFDRTELSPPGVQAELVKAIYETGTPTVVVLLHGRPYSISWMAENIPAIVEAWYPGEEGGSALADVLFGKVNPSGKLTISVPRSVGHVPAFYNHKPSARGSYYCKPGTPEVPGRDYVFSSPRPLFEFGHGLSYTTFKYSNLRVSPQTILPGATVDVAVDVRNTGKVSGNETVQLYINDVVSSVTTAVKVLRGFEKIHLKPGQKRTVRFVLKPKDLELLDENMNWIVEPGIFEVMVGELKKTFEVVRSQ